MGAFSVFLSKKTAKSATSKGYYRRLSVYFSLAKYLCLLLALATVLYGFSFRADEINADNFRYLLSFLGDGETDNQTYNTVYYDNNETNRFALVRGDLAVVNNSGVAVYTLSGTRRSVDTGLRMDNPSVISSAKYMYIYDLSGAELVVKSTLETVSTLSYDYPIRAVAATDSGYFAVVSEKKTSRSSVFVYDDEQRIVYNCSYNSLYTVSVDLDNSAKQLVSASVEAVNGEFVTTVNLYSLSKEEPLATHSITGEYPYNISFSADGGMVLLTDRCCHFFNKSAEEVSVLEFGVEGISNFDMGDNYFLRQYSLSTLTSAVRLEAYDNTDGSLVWKKDFDSGLRLAKTYDRYLYTVSEQRLTVTDLKNDTSCSFDFEENVRDIIPVEEGKILVLTDGSGNVLNFDGMLK